jgi:hypothetical protein
MVASAGRVTLWASLFANAVTQIYFFAAGLLPEAVVVGGNVIVGGAGLFRHLVRGYEW